MEFVSPIEALLQGYAKTVWFQRQQQLLGKPLYTRQEELLVKSMERVLSQFSINTVWLMGIPSLVCPPPPYDTPPPVFMSFNSIKPSENLIHELQKTTRETPRKNTTTAISPWVFQKWITLIPTHQSDYLSETTKPIYPNNNKLIRGSYEKEDQERKKFKNSVRWLNLIQFGSTTTLSTHNYDFELFDINGAATSINIVDLVRCVYRGIRSPSKRFHSSASHGFWRKKLWGIMEIKWKLSKGTKVKALGIIMGGTKLFYCQRDITEKRTVDSLHKSSQVRNLVSLV